MKKNHPCIFRTVVTMTLVIALILSSIEVALASPGFMATSETASQSIIYVKKGKTKTIIPRYLASGDKVLVFDSSDKKIASVSKKGVVTGEKTGTAVITVRTADGDEDDIKVKVVKKKKNAKSISLPDTETVNANTISRLDVTISPKTATSEIEWSSSDKDVASVDGAGYITAKKAGVTVITVETDNGKKSTCELTVKDNPKSVPATGISVSPTTKKIFTSETVSINHTLENTASSDISNDAVYWSSSDELIATVDADGVVTGVGYGVAEITAVTGSGKTAIASITVNDIKTEYTSTVQLTPGVKFQAFRHYGNPETSYEILGDSDIISDISDGAIIAKSRPDKGQPAKTGKATIISTTSKGEIDVTRIEIVDSPTIADLSHHNGDIDWKTASKSLDLVIHKATEGTTFVDKKYTINTSACAKYGVPYGAYAYARYGNGSTVEEKNKLAIDEATHFYNTVKESGQVPNFWVIDCEEKGITAESTSVYINQLKSLAAADGVINLKVGVYVAHHLYSAYDLDLDREDPNQNAPDFVWIPRYSNENNGTISGVPTPKESFVIDLWQFTSGGGIPGIKGKVDLNTLTFENGNRISANPDFNLAWLSSF